MIKRLYTFILKSFLPLFAMTFFIVLFIVLMQFLWKYIDDLVGKGLPLEVIAELFFYAAVSMVPMALPLAILLASLMTFGNLGEKFELTAMKAAGISLIQVMAPLIVLISGISIGAFFFQNDVLPHAQVKMWTLLFSMKQKSPEVEIPEGVFYDQIPGYNLFVEKKNPDTGVLKRVMIYDVSKGGDNASIVLADSAQIAFTKDNRYLYLHLYRGEQFENLQDRSAGQVNVPFRREQFEDKQVLIPFDANFNRMDDQSMRKQYVGKNITELRQTIDSVTKRVDSIGDRYARALLTTPIAGMTRQWDTQKKRITPFAEVSTPQPQGFDLDSIMENLTQSDLQVVFSSARQHIMTLKSEYEFKSETMADDKKSIRRHEIELLKKFTLSVACLIMFFIGAPLGAIIRKGGLGTPLVISVLLFLVYYIIDNTGYKMARDGRWPVWIGMWISTFVLAPLGIYVTYKAMNDSAVFDKDAWMIKLRRLLGIKSQRFVPYKEVIINDITPTEALLSLQRLHEDTRRTLSLLTRRYDYAPYWANTAAVSVNALSEELEATVAYLTDSRDNEIISLLGEYPVIRAGRLLSPGLHPIVATLAKWFVPVGIPIYFTAGYTRQRLIRDIRKIIDVTNRIKNKFEENQSAEI